jgi:predicted kinase
LPLWNLVLTGYPSSGKTFLARRLVQDNPTFARISGDDLRTMLFNEPIPSRDEELVYSMLTLMRDELLRHGHSVVIDTTAPTNQTRTYLMSTKAPNVDSLLIVVVANRELLLERANARGHFGAVEAWDTAWEAPEKRVPTFKFRNDNLEEFGTNYYVLTELLNSRYHPYKRRFLSNIFPRIHG